MLKRILVPMVALLLTVGCGAAPTPGDATTPLEASEVRNGFAWVPGSRATVVQEMNLGGTYRSKNRYNIELTECKEDDGYVLQMSEFEFLTYNDQVVAGELAEQLKIATTLAQIQPPMHISDDGEYLGYPKGYDFRTLVNEKRQTVLASIPENDWRNLETMWNNPEFDATAYRGGWEYWHRWVAAWNPFDGKSDGPVESTGVMRLASDLTYPIRGTVQRVDDDTLSEELVRLHYASVHENPALKEFEIRDALNRMPVKPEYRDDPKLEEKMRVDLNALFAKVTKTVEIDAVIYKADHRPVEVIAKETTVALAEYGGEKTDVDTFHYTFEWQ